MQGPHQWQPEAFYTSSRRSGQHTRFPQQALPPAQKRSDVVACDGSRVSTGFLNPDKRAICRQCRCAHAQHHAQRQQYGTQFSFHLNSSSYFYRFPRLPAVGLQKNCPPAKQTRDSSTRKMQPAVITRPRRRRALDPFGFASLPFGRFASYFFPAENDRFSPGYIRIIPRSLRKSNPQNRLFQTF